MNIDTLDADMLTAELTRIGNASAKARKEGFCTHTWLQGFSGQRTVCNHCGKVFPTLESAYEEGREHLDLYR